jgi:membrane associated rhomboid family serine protease
VIPILFFPLIFTIPAVAFAFFWLLTQIIPGIAALRMPTDGSGIAWWAHIGGFAAGWVLMPVATWAARGYRGN